MSKLDEFKKPLVIYPHPDDEAIGCSSALFELRNRVHIAYATDGAPPPEMNPEYYRPHTEYEAGKTYVEMRREEARKALAEVSITDQSRIHFLGFEDSNLKQDIDKLTEAIRTLIQKTAPDLIITAAIENGHEDHDLVTKIIWKIVKENDRTVTICETPLYYPDKNEIVHNKPAKRHNDWETMIHRAIPKKRKMFKAYRSQQTDLQYFDPGAEEYYHFMTHRPQSLHE